MAEELTDEKASLWFREIEKTIDSRKVCNRTWYVTTKKTRINYEDHEEALAEYEKAIK